MNVSKVTVIERAGVPAGDYKQGLLLGGRLELSDCEFSVHPASGAKCARCWNFMPEVSNYGIWENVCTRCQSALKEMGIAPPQPEAAE